MKCALKEAQKAFADGEVPIGAVVVLDGRSFPADITGARKNK